MNNSRFLLHILIIFISSSLVCGANVYLNNTSPCIKRGICYYNNESDTLYSNTPTPWDTLNFSPPSPIIVVFEHLITALPGIYASHNVTILISNSTLLFNKEIFVMESITIKNNSKVDGYYLTADSLYLYNSRLTVKDNIELKGAGAMMTSSLNATVVNCQSFSLSNSIFSASTANVSVFNAAGKACFMSVKTFYTKKAIFEKIDYLTSVDDITADHLIIKNCMEVYIQNIKLTATTNSIMEYYPLRNNNNNYIKTITANTNNNATIIIKYENDYDIKRLLAFNVGSIKGMVNCYLGNTVLFKAENLELGYIEQRPTTVVRFHVTNKIDFTKQTSLFGDVKAMDTMYIRIFEGLTMIPINEKHCFYDFDKEGSITISGFFYCRGEISVNSMFLVEQTKIEAKRISANWIHSYYEINLKADDVIINQQLVLNASSPMFIDGNFTMKDELLVEFLGFDTFITHPLITTTGNINLEGIDVAFRSAPREYSKGKKSLIFAESLSGSIREANLFNIFFESIDSSQVTRAGYYVTTNQVIIGRRDISKFIIGGIFIVLGIQSLFLLYFYLAWRRYRANLQIGLQEQEMSDQSVSDQSIPDQSIPDQSMSDQSM